MSDLRSIVIGIVLMLRKYTCIDITVYAETSEGDYKNGIFALPLIGFAVGFAAFLISLLKVFYDRFFVSVLILSYYNIITKTINMRDTYTTFNYYIKPKNQSDKLSGIIGIVLINLMYFSLFSIVPSSALIVMAVTGYSCLIIVSPIINRNKDNTTIIKYCGKYHVAAAFAISFFIASIFNYKLVIPLSLTYILSIMAVSILDEKIKLFPSSIEGTIIEIAQLLFLIITCLLKI
jgi:hypothetical protein